MPRLDAFQEVAFRRWYAGWSEFLGLNPDPDEAAHFYDYRGAFLKNAKPQFNPETGHYHWPSKFKMEGHPREVIDGVNTRTGERLK